MEKLLLEKVWALYEAALAERNNEDYEINRPQMGRFLNAYEFFERISNGSIEPMDLEPKRLCASITAYFNVLYLSDDDLDTFGKIAEVASAMTIDSLINGEVCVSLTIPDVYIRK